MDPPSDGRLGSSLIARSRFSLVEVIGLFFVDATSPMHDEFSLYRNFVAIIIYERKWSYMPQGIPLSSLQNQLYLLFCKELPYKHRKNLNIGTAKY